MILDNDYKKRKSNYSKNKTFFVIVGILVVIIYGFYLVDKSVKPIVLAMSEVRARMIATQAINDAVKEKIKGDIKYKDLIDISYDKDGKVATMQANTMLMNTIASEVALEVQNKMRAVSASSIRIPIGTAFKSQILSQYGPKISVNIMPQGSVKVDFETEFEQSGINQTIHRVYLTIQAQVRIVIPLGADTAKITSTVPIAETIIIGDVPQSFINVPKDDFMNVVPGS
ncbi:sporulation protein YunB [Clostridiaceae bacterium M8S5]|nr:sporulation protein YunB [Clostridiaceae bacterium M8S5]